MSRTLAPVLQRIHALRLATAFLIATALGCGLDPAHDPWPTPIEAAAQAAPAPRQPCAHTAPLRQSFFGDLHVHTGLSMDARGRDTVLGPRAAYRFATGEEIAIGPHDEQGRGTRRIRIDRPLDFAAVTDHAEWLGEVQICSTPGSPSYDTQGCRVFRGEDKTWLARVLRLDPMVSKLLGVTGFSGRSRAVCGDDLGLCRGALTTAWQQIRDAAEEFQDRSEACRFTTFHGWEYSRSPGRSKVHRNVIFRNEIVPELPLSWIDTPTSVELREKLRQLCTENGSGCDAIAIPHNPNLSNGQMFTVSYRDLPIDAQREAARVRARFEPVVEMVQMKGESECRNGFTGVVGGPDELCDFAKIRERTLQPFEDCGEGTGEGAMRGQGCASRLDYVRYALLEGLREEQRIGVNPYPFGFIGSTDTHNVNPGDVAEWQHPGTNGSPADSAVKRLTLPEEGDYKTRHGIIRSAGGLVGVWAEENSRDAIFDALRRRETFATSGPRIRPRLFAGWDLPADVCARPDLVERGYRDGVPMGGVLEASPSAAQAPRLVVSALRDPGTPEHPGGLLQRAQIVKVWVGADGLFHQAIYDVAGRAGNGASVDLATCTPRGPGANALCGVWQDPDFDPEMAAIYYARIVENPSCRWSTRQCLDFAASERPDGCDAPHIPKLIQERAWTSPIWYEPSPAREGEVQPSKG